MPSQAEAYGEGDSIGAAVIDAHQKLPRDPSKPNEQIKSRVVEFGAETNGQSGVIMAWATVRQTDASA